MTVSEQQRIEDFIDKECQADEHGNFYFNREGLIYLFGDFQKQDAWKFDSEAMARVVYDQSIESQAQARLDAFIKHEKEQRLFIAANSAMNGILAGRYFTDNQDDIVANRSFIFAKALLAKIEKETANQNPQQ